MISHRPKFSLIRGEFAPIFWEPIGCRGERLVVGVLLTQPNQVTHAHITLHHHRLLDFISEGKSESASGVIRFAFDHFTKTLSAGGQIDDLKAPFSTMTIGRTEAISARTSEELLDRAIRLCTLLGNMPASEHKIYRSNAVATTASFLRDVRKYVSLVDKDLARMTLKTTQFITMGDTRIRVHFQHKGRFAQFCSLPKPNARPENATECDARLADLSLIKKMDPNAQVALCINTQTLEIAQNYQGHQNATHLIQERALLYARSFDIDIKSYNDPTDAGRFLHAMASA